MPDHICLLNLNVDQLFKLGPAQLVCICEGSASDTSKEVLNSFYSWFFFVLLSFPYYAANLDSLLCWMLCIFALSSYFIGWEYGTTGNSLIKGQSFEKDTANRNIAISPCHKLLFNECGQWLVLQQNMLVWFLKCYQMSMT